MNTYVAFLRGINVGGHRVKMDALRELFEELELTDVATFIASGNVIFSSPSDDVGALTETIEGHLLQRLDYDVPTFLRTPAQLEAITNFVSADERGRPPDSSIYVMLLRKPASRSIRAAFAGIAPDTEEFRFSGSEVYWLLEGKLSDSPLFGKGVERALGGAATTSRNLNTLRRLVVKIRGSGGNGS